MLYSATFNSTYRKSQSVIVKPTGCGFDPHLRRWNIYLNLYFHFFALVSRQSAALNSGTQHAMPPEFGRKWGTECLITKVPLPTLLGAGYSVKLILYRKSQVHTLLRSILQNFNTLALSLISFVTYIIYAVVWTCLVFQ